uniref:Ribosomal protein S10, eukaryotic and archaeal form n=1 Tax=Solanum tuberosum TaxID=4113 RepID=M1BI01_SOLTU
MVYVTMKPTKLGLEGPERRLIKTTLSTKNVKNLEKMCTNLICGAKDRSFRVKGLVEMPTKLRDVVKQITTEPGVEVDVTIVDS